MRKLQAVSAKESPLGRRSVTRGLNGIVEETDNNPSSRRRTPEDVGGRNLSEQEEEEMRLRKKELEAQKARIVAQMAPVREEQDEDDVEMEEDDDEVEIVAFKQLKPKEREAPKLRERYAAANADRENVPPVPTGRGLSAGIAAAKYQVRAKEQPTTRLGALDKENLQATGAYFSFLLLTKY